MNIIDFKRKKTLNKKISVITCYDYPSARIIAESKIDCVLVGDSVAMTMHGHETTINATIDMMVLHTAAVARGLNNQFLVSDLPFLAHRLSREKTIEQVRTLIQAGAQAVKIEGGDADTCNTISYVTQAGVPVMGHIGLTPQSIHQLGGYAIQGKEQTQADHLLHQAKALEQAGCFAVVIECVPKQVAKRITNELSIPTIGIGAGYDTDGQVLVWHDLLGMQTDFKPRFVKQYINGKELLLNAINTYAEEVNGVLFPTHDHAF